jgi:hydroxyethylthiazole kinase-like uncharacterized protein yjeF
MKVCSCQEMQVAEQQLIASGTPALDLMNQAARNIAEAIIRFYPQPGLCIAFTGKGNNGGDAIAVLNILQQCGWEADIAHPYPTEEWGELARLQLSRLSRPLWKKETHPSGREFPHILLLDGLLGLGAKGDLRPEIAACCRTINRMRQSSNAFHTWAIDLPTGIDGDTGEVSDDAVVADHTSVIGGVKQGLLADSATSYAGRLVSIPMDGLELPDSCSERILIDSYLLRRFPIHRPYELFKNQAGHVAVIAGSYSMPGAARLCSEAALRAGAGLVTLFVTEELYPILAPALPPEIMIKPVSGFDQCEPDHYQTLLIGPGLGTISEKNARIIHGFIREFQGTIVLDADGLNCAARENWTLGPNVLATPHPGEMKRLLHTDTSCLTREEIVREFTRRHEAALIYKGARSIVTASGAPVFYNSSGGPAMATAGQGDVLAGVCAGWCAQGLAPVQSALLSTYLCGCASEILLATGRQTEQTLCAGDTLRALPLTIRSISEATLP